MKQHRWQPLAITLAAIGISHPVFAQTAPIGPPAAPKLFVPQEFLPGPGRWISTVDNFNGLVAGANIQGTGKDDKGNVYDWEVDVRVMQGNYIDRDANSHRGTFCFT